MVRRPRSAVGREPPAVDGQPPAFVSRLTSACGAAPRAMGRTVPPPSAGGGALLFVGHRWEDVDFIHRDVWRAGLRARAPDYPVLRELLPAFSRRANDAAQSGRRVTHRLQERRAEVWAAIRPGARDRVYVSGSATVIQQLLFQMRGLAMDPALGNMSAARAARWIEEAMATHRIVAEVWAHGESGRQRLMNEARAKFHRVVKKVFFSVRMARQKRAALLSAGMLEAVPRFRGMSRAQLSRVVQSMRYEKHRCTSWASAVVWWTGEGNRGGGGSRAPAASAPRPRSPPPPAAPKSLGHAVFRAFS